MAAAAGTLAWVFTEWIHRGKPTVLGAASGCIAGLGTITPASGFVQPVSALLIGAAAGSICYGAVMMKGRLGYDDSLDVVGVHCVGGVLGMLATGLFATKLVNPGGADGLFYGNPKQLAIQALAAGVVLVYSFLVTYALLKVLDKLMGLRVSREDEGMGLDLSEHGEAGYTW
jgi:Amt family ammonium transporter